MVSGSPCLHSCSGGARFGGARWRVARRAFGTGERSHGSRGIYSRDTQITRAAIQEASSSSPPEPAPAPPDLQSPLCPAEHVHIVRDFLPHAAALREKFDENFADPRSTQPGRFVWDYWHVPGQYTQLRTPAIDYFTPSDYQRLEAALLDYGKEVLGCVGVTQIWLSYYVDGCKQDLHCDNVHGPWAFVLSLTDWESRRFSGGETLLLSSFSLNFWGHFSPDSVVERDTLTRVVPPRWNQLLVFDPRVPHGVREVRGVREPPAARVVLHGWFVEPEMFVEGALTFEEAKAGVDVSMAALTARADELPEATGTAVLRLSIRPDGHVASLRFLTDTVVPRPWAVPDNDEERAHGMLQSALLEAFAAHVYPAKAEPSSVTMPVLFE